VSGYKWSPLEIELPEVNIRVPCALRIARSFLAPDIVKPKIVVIVSIAMSHKSRKIIEDIGFYKNFRISNFLKNGDRDYRLFHLWRTDMSAFCTQSHFSRAFLTSIFFTYTHKSTLTQSHAHIRERLAFHWHSASRGEFHLYANLKPRTHFCIPPWDPVETCPMQLHPRACATRSRTSATGGNVSQKFSLLSDGQIRRYSLCPK